MECFGERKADEYLGLGDRDASGRIVRTQRVEKAIVACGPFRGQELEIDVHVKAIECEARLPNGSD